MKFNHRRFFFACLLLSLLLGWLARASKVHTQISITLDGKNALFVVNGIPVSVPWTETRLTSIEVKTRDSAFAMGGETIQVEQNGGTVWQDSLPETFLFDRSDFYPVGDWWVDYRTGPEKRVFFRQQNIAGPFHLTATFTGRSLHAVRILLNGDERLQFEFRRGLMSNDFGISDPRRMLEGAPLEPDPLASLAVMMEPWLLGGALACLRAVMLSALAAGTEGPARPAFWPGFAKNRMEPWIVAGLVCAAGTIFAWTATSILERLPHFQDDLCYLARAKWLLAGHWFQPMPFYRKFIESFPFLIFDDVRHLILTRYPITWSAFLAMGEAAGIAWLVSPVFGALGVWLVYRIGKSTSGAFTAGIAALLLLTSPLMILLSASMLSHAATHFFCILHALGLLWGLERKSRRWLLLSGMAIGIAAGIRPLTAIGMLLPAAGLFVHAAIRTPLRVSLSQSLGFSLGMAVGLLPFLADNYLATGNPLQTAYSLIGVRLTFRPEEIPHRLLLADATLSFIPLHIYGWGWRWCPSVLAMGFTCLFPLLPFLLGRWNRYDVFFAALCVSVPLAYLVHAEAGSHAFGPRYYFEITFAFVLLTARGISALLTWLREISPSGARLPRGIVWALLGTFWLGAAWNLPARLALYRGYNDVNGSLEKAVRSAHADPAIVFLENDSYTNWIKTANLLSGDWQKPDILVAAGIPDKKETLMRAFPNRPAYMWSQENRLIVLPPKEGRTP